MIYIKKICGKKASGGIAEGKLYVVRRDGAALYSKADDAETELERYREARERAASEIEELRKKAASDAGESEAMIFDIHRMMLYDDDFDKSIVSMIRQGADAVSAVLQTAEKLGKLFSDMSGDYMKGRAADVKDVARRVTDALSGRRSAVSPDCPSVIAADELTPGETVNLDKKLALGFITEGGSDSSHSAILSRTMGIPSVVAAGKIDSSLDGKYCILDGDEGALYIEPDEETRERLLGKKREQEERICRLDSFRGKLTETKDGRRIRVYANIGEPDDVHYAASADAEGIGLFRSEFLYMKYGRLPTEDEQFDAYRTAGEKMGKKELIVRTLDAGADKKIDYLGLKKEANPALGLRAIRLCMKNEEAFLTQLRALYRASAYTPVSIMFPMIVSADEIIKAKELCAMAREQLRAEGKAFDENVKIGIMIETPAAAVCADILAEHADFFSIGTNDLIQYTLAADRENPEVSYITKGAHEAVLRLISYTAECAAKAGIWVGICGEMGADTALTEFFLNAGITELSVTPSRVLEVREAVMSADTSKYQISQYCG